MPDTYTQFLTKNPVSDPVDGIRRFADYTRTELAKTGELTPELNDEIGRAAYAKAVETGALAAPTTPEEEAAGSIF